MTNFCEACDFHASSGGSCHGFVKNPDALVPFYICPHEAEREKLKSYFDGAAANPAGVPPNCFFAPTKTPATSDSGTVKNSGNAAR